MAGASFFERLDLALTDLLSRTEDERAARLEALHREDAALAAELEILLAGAERAERLLGLHAGEARDRLLWQALRLDELLTDAPESRVGQQIGPFRLECELARGLRSEVYRAHRLDPEWRQEVVVKLLTRGVTTDDVLRRFLAERQILSVLHHPHIATVLDGGVTDDGLPYFVMEYIDGQPVTTYCNRQRLGLPARLELCRQMCAAVAFAHRHLVVHRDIKPSNILVNQEGQVRLLDFGIAKLLDPIIDPAIAPRTEEHVRPMTPQYASPEQRAGGAITTASDVYQLGRVFTEILAGMPAPERGTEGATADALFSSLPETPRHAGSNALPEAPSKLAARFGTGLPYPASALRGDLDWILLKALDPEPTNRYGSAAELLVDLERYFTDQPVAARRASLPYLARKFTRRHPVWSVSLALALLATLGFVVTLTVFTQRLEIERTAALAAAARAEEVKRLLVQFIAAPDPFSGAGADARVSDVLQASEEDISRALADRPELRLELLATLADVYQNLALHERSVAVREEELRLRRELGTDAALEALQSRRKLAQSREVLGAIEQSLAEFEALRVELATDHPAALAERAIVDTGIGAIHANYGKAAEALPYLDAAVRELEKLGTEPVLLADALHQRALAVGALTRHEEALDLLQRAYTLRLEHQGPQHVSTLMERSQVAANLTNRGRYEDSIAIYAEVLPVLERQLGRLHERVLTVLNNSAVSHDLAGQLERSAELHRDSLSRRREKFGDEHGDVADSLQNLGSVLTRLEHYDDALATLTEAARVFPRVYQPGSPRLAYPHLSLAIVYSHTGAETLLEQHARTALALLEGNVPAAHPALLRGRCLLGDALIRRGDLAAGVPLLQESIAGLATQVGISPAHLEACNEALARASAGGATASP